jgi:hypothetical protein
MRHTINQLFDELQEVLKNPTDNPNLWFFLLWACRPPTIDKESTITDATTLVTFSFDSTQPTVTRSEVRRFVKEGSLKWNGTKVTDPFMPLTWLAPGWGVIQHGKKHFRPILCR